MGPRALVLAGLLAVAAAIQGQKVLKAEEADDAWPSTIKFAVDYYPSQWPESMWKEDAQRMANASISHVRISEFDWKVLEPKDGHYDWSLLDKSIEVLDSQGIKVILGTPTAAPPIWAVRDYDILASDNELRQRRFGSRRHYSFSSPDFQMLSKRFVDAMAQRYGKNDAVALWHLDNEFGNHANTRSYDKHAQVAFRHWLSKKYDGSIDKLNEAQGRVFWSSQYDSFDDILVPTLEQTESSPALRFDFFEFSSDQLIDYAVLQAETIRKHSDKPITTNLMPFEFSFDHHKLARRVKLDTATWDSYPLGNTESLDWVSDADKITYSRTGRPDAQALQHALYRGVAGAATGKGRGPWGIMEQQPGPVNWAVHNPSPAPGMVRVWLHDMLSQGSSLNNIFRWREVPYGQEQMHAGMFRIDNSPDLAHDEQGEVVNDVEKLRKAGLLDDELNWTGKSKHAKVAMVLDYPSSWALEANPQGGTFDLSTFTGYDFQYPELLSEWHAAFRRLAVDVDIISPSTSDEALSEYRLVVIPTMVKLSKDFEARLDRFKGDVVVGPRFASKVDTLSVPIDLPPSSSHRHSGGDSNGTQADLNNTFAARLPMRVTRVESIRKDLDDEFVTYKDKQYPLRTWVEWLDCARGGKNSSDGDGLMTLGGHHRKGSTVLCQHRRAVPGGSGSGSNDTQLTTYLGFYATTDILLPFFADRLANLGVHNALDQLPDASQDLGQFLRLARYGERALFAFNYGDRAEVDLTQWPNIQQGLLSSSKKLIVGRQNTTIAPADVQIWDLA